jgi:hypothetical protein
MTEGCRHFYLGPSERRPAPQVGLEQLYRVEGGQPIANDRGDEATCG